MASREETTIAQARRAAERQQYPAQMEFQQRPTEECRAATKAPPESEDQGRDLSSSAASNPSWRPLSTHKWTPQQRAKYSKVDFGSYWSSSSGAGGKESGESSSAPAANLATLTNETYRAESLLRRVSKSPKQDGNGGRSEQSAAAPTLAALAARPPYLEMQAPFDRSYPVAFDEEGSRSSSSNSASSISARSSTSTSAISGPSTGTTTPARQRATANTHRTNESATNPTTTPPHPPSPAAAAPESWFRPCSESDKRAAKYLINNTASTSNEDLAALLHKDDAQKVHGRGGIVSVLASLRKAALQHRQIAEEDWERAVLEEDEYEIVTTTTTTTRTTSTYSAMGVRGEKRRKETRERERLLLRPDVEARWHGLVVDQDRVRQLPRVKEG